MQRDVRELMKMWLNEMVLCVWSLRRKQRDSTILKAHLYEQMIVSYSKKYNALSNIWVIRFHYVTII